MAGNVNIMGVQDATGQALRFQKVLHIGNHADGGRASMRPAPSASVKSWFQVNDDRLNELMGKKKQQQQQAGEGKSGASGKEEEEVLPLGPEVWLGWVDAAMRLSLHAGLQSAIKAAEEDNSGYVLHAGGGVLPASHAGGGDNNGDSVDAAPASAGRGLALALAAAVTEEGGGTEGADGAWVTQYSVQVL